MVGLSVMNSQYGFVYEAGSRVAFNVLIGEGALVDAVVASRGAGWALRMGSWGPEERTWGGRDAMEDWRPLEVPWRLVMLKSGNIDDN